MDNGHQSIFNTNYNNDLVDGDRKLKRLKRTKKHSVQINAYILIQCNNHRVYPVVFDLISGLANCNETTNRPRFDMKSNKLQKKLIPKS